MKRHFTEDDVQTVNKPMKRCQAHQPLGECHLELQADITTHLLERLKKKVVTTINACTDAEKLDDLHIDGGTT